MRASTGLWRSGLPASAELFGRRLAYRLDPEPRDAAHDGRLCGDQGCGSTGSLQAEAA